MFKFIIASNGHAVSHIPPFATKAEASAYLINNDLGELKYTAEVVELETKPVTCTCIDYAGDFDEAGQPSLECFGCDSGRLAPIDYVAMLSAKEKALAEERKERAIDEANIKMYLSIIEDQKAKFNGVRDYIQASINRGEWEDELDEIFWHELADKLGLDLGLTEEIDVTVTITYSGTITVPKDADLDDVEFDTTWHLTGNYLGEEVAELTYNDIEITRD